MLRAPESVLGDIGVGVEERDAVASPDDTLGVASRPGPRLPDV